MHSLAPQRAPTPMLASPLVVGVKSAMTTTSAGWDPVWTPTPVPRPLAVSVAKPPPTGIVAFPLGAPLASIPTPVKSADSDDQRDDQDSAGCGADQHEVGTTLRLGGPLVRGRPRGVGGGRHRGGWSR